MWKYIINSHWFTIIFPIAVTMSVVVGTQIARRTWIRKNIEWKSSGVDSAVVAIFSLLLSFTFFASNNLMRDRLVILSDMADASASLRRASLFTNDSIKDETKKYLIQYLTLVSNFKENYLSSERVLSKDMEDVNISYLNNLSMMAKRDPAFKSDILIIMPFINKMIGTFYRTLGSYDDRTPPLIIILLVWSSLLIGVLIGFLNSFNNKTHYLVPIIFIVIVSLCIQGIRDLDNPYIGTIQPSFSDFKNQLDMLINGRS
jgi:hypothetical protein